MIKKGLLLLFIFISFVGFSFYVGSHAIELTFDDAYSQCETISFEFVYEAFSREHPRYQYLDDYVNIETVDDLFDESDMIVEVQLDARRQMNNIIESDFHVLTCYKGEKKKNISVYEPAYLQNENRTLISFQNKPLFKKEIKYLLFLKKAISDGHYNLVNTCLGSYPIKKDISEITIEANETGDAMISLQECNNLDYLNIDYSHSKESMEQEGLKALELYNKQKNKYIPFQKEIFERLEIDIENIPSF